MPSSLGALFVLAFYFLPGIVASMRGHMSAGAIFVLNLLLGWTALGWIIALVLVVHRQHKGELPGNVRSAADQYGPICSVRPLSALHLGDPENDVAVALRCPTNGREHPDGVHPPARQAGRPAGSAAALVRRRSRAGFRRWPGGPLR